MSIVKRIEELKKQRDWIDSEIRALEYRETGEVILDAIERECIPLQFFTIRKNPTISLKL